MANPLTKEECHDRLAQLYDGYHFCEDIETENLCHGDTPKKRAICLLEHFRFIKPIRERTSNKQQASGFTPK